MHLRKSRQRSRRNGWQSGQVPGLPKRDSDSGNWRSENRNRGSKVGTGETDTSGPTEATCQTRSSGFETGDASDG